MAESTVKNPCIPKNFDKFVAYSSKQDQSCVDDLIFSFLEEDDQDSLKSSCDRSIDFSNSVEISEEEEDESVDNADESKAFWESQEELLKATLYRTSSLESKIRKATKDALKELNMVGVQYCLCRRTTIDGCKNCLREDICGRLRDVGYNCIIRNSKWRSSTEIPSGEHTYMEVVHSSNSRKEEIKVIIELNFRSEFEVARASEEYNRLIKLLPEVYVGKTERLRTLIKILCSASKMCMKERKMHMAPWRKHKYMEAKWLLGTPAGLKHIPILAMEYQEKRQRPRASMLTFDLLDSVPSWHSKAIKVI